MTADSHNREARAQIVEVADRLFYTHGVQSVGMDAIRDAAGVSLKRLYSLFPSKQELVLAVLADRSQQWQRGIASAAAQLDDPHERLLAIFDFLREWFGTDGFRGCAFINAFGELGATMPAVAAAVREQKHQFGAYVAGLCAQLGAPESLAPQLAILAEGAQTTAAIAGQTSAALDARDAAEVLIAHALADAADTG